MSWSYDPTLSTDKDKVRFEIQDTESSDQLFSDEEIAATLTAQGGVMSASLKLANLLLMKWVRFVDTTVGRVSESASQRVTNLKDIIARLENNLSLAQPEFGGIDHDKNDALDQDDSLVQSWETREGMTNLADRNTFGGGD